jgi:hypothetical protein
MPQVITQRIELELTLDQILAIVRQLKPREREIVRRAIESPPWSQRLDALLARVWSRVECYPITEEEVDAEVEAARTALYAQGSR